MDEPHTATLAFPPSPESSLLIASVAKMQDGRQAHCRVFAGDPRRDCGICRERPCEATSTGSFLWVCQLFGPARREEERHTLPFPLSN